MPQQKVFLITGTSTGFGRAFAEAARAAGHRVVATARRVDALASLDADLALPLDVTKPDQIDAAVRAAVAAFGRIDVLINNAGYGIVGAVEETPDAELRAQLETNFFGAIAMIRAVLPVMREQRAGAIVNISSLGGQLSFAGFSAYSASKFALEGASEALASEVRPFGIKVLIAEPGSFRTAFAGAALKAMPALPAYADTVGGTRAFAAGMHGTQAGDPRKAAAAVLMALDSDATPLRLQLGQDAIDAVRSHSQELLRDLAEWEAVGRATALD
jgi:NAD(P)-dependent dehydrogenase (short-subunit alcohol dehydrogenase family)